MAPTPLKPRPRIRVHRQFLPGCRRFWTAAAFGVCAAACTDPTSVGESPTFIGLVTYPQGVLPAAPALQLPNDSCLSVSPNTGDVTRRSLPGSSAAFAFPSSATVTVARFAGNRGAVFTVSGSGTLAVSYDNDLAEFQSQERFGQRWVYEFTETFERWCNVTINTRPARLHFKRLDSRVSFIASQDSLFVPDMALRTTSASGRPVNIRVTSFTLRGGFGARDPAVFRLLGVAASMQW